MTYRIGPDLVIRFDAKPADAIRSMLKSAGLRWSPAGQCWHRSYTTGAADLIERLDKALHPGRPDGPCWTCKAPGRFRYHGAATPVYCDGCHEKYVEAQKRRYQPDQTDLAYEDQCRSVCGL